MLGPMLWLRHSLPQPLKYIPHRQRLAFGFGQGRFDAQVLVTRELVTRELDVAVLLDRLNDALRIEQWVFRVPPDLRLLRHQASRLDQLCMQLDVARDQGAQILGAGGSHIHADLGKLAPVVRIERSDHRAIELIDDGFGCFRRRKQSDPGRKDQIADAALDHGRHLGEDRRAVRRHHRQGIKRPRFHMLDRFRHHGEDGIHGAGDRVVDGQRAAPVGDMQQFGLRPRFKHQASQMLGAAVA